MITSIARLAAPCHRLRRHPGTRSNALFALGALVGSLSALLSSPMPALATVQVGVANGTLTVHGMDIGEQLMVHGINATTFRVTSEVSDLQTGTGCTGSHIQLTCTAVTVGVNIGLAAGADGLTINGAADYPGTMQADTGGGDDTIDITGYTSAATVSGGEGNDTLSAANNATFNGGNGDDTARLLPPTNASEPTFFSGTDATLHAETGIVVADLGTTSVEHGALVGTTMTALFQDVNNNFPVDLVGGDGDDWSAFPAGSAATSFDGGSGSDTVDVGGSDITVTDDTVNGVFPISSIEDLSVEGTTGNDTLDVSGFSGDVAAGMDTGDDVVTAGGGELDLDGGDGVDELRFSTTADGGATVFAPAEIDTPTRILYIDNLEQAVMTGGAGADKVNLGASTLQSLSVAAGGGNDVIDSRGFAQAISADGGAGNDRIRTGAGADTIHGRAGNDTIDAGRGADTIFGDAGADSIIARDKTRDKRIDCGGGKGDKVTLDRNDPKRSRGCERISRK